MFHTESSAISSGYATYTKELLPRLAATGKYELAEFANFGKDGDSKWNDYVKGRWKTYGVMPNNPQENEQYHQNSNSQEDGGQNINIFGAYKFNQAVADFQPDAVCSILDNWMSSYILRSPFRKWFKMLWLGPTDGMPQNESWIHDFEQCDLTMCYSDFGIHTLKQQSQRIKLFPQPMRTGVDLDVFKPMDRLAVKAEFSIQPDIPIIGAVYRNQKRKLFFDLIDAFAKMKSKYKGEKAIDKSILLIHSAWPDNPHSFDYPRHVMRLQAYPWMPNHFKGIKDSVMQTVMCHGCGRKSVNFAFNLYNKPLTNIGGVPTVVLPCPHCGEQKATCPYTAGGYTREELAKVYAMMDLYIQCASNEGDSLPMQEAKATGCPVMAVDYSAMAEKVRFPSEYTHFQPDKLKKTAGVSEANYSCHKGGVPIKVDRFFHESETSRIMALPDINDMADNIRDLLNNDEKRLQLGRDARQCVETNYDWDKLIKQWEFVLDNVKAKERTNTWDSPIEVLPEPTTPSVPAEISAGTDEEYVKWLYLNVLKYPTVDTDGMKNWLQHLGQGATRQYIYDYFANVAKGGTNEENARQSVRVAIAEKNGQAVRVKAEVVSKGEWL